MPGADAGRVEAVTTLVGERDDGPSTGFGVGLARDAGTIVLLPVAATMLVAFAVVESHVNDPFVQPDLPRTARLVVANIVMATIGSFVASSSWRPSTSTTSCDGRRSRRRWPSCPVAC